jgi:DNA-binding CsgD family transcriptional regulator
MIDQAAHHSETPADPASSTMPTLIQTAVRMASTAARLPAIATLDWCELAARTMSLLDPGATAGVLLAPIGDDGVVRGFEAAGVARNESPDVATPSLPAIADLRWRLESMPNLGWEPARHVENPRLAGGRLSHIVPMGWRETPSYTIFGTLQPSEVFVGVATVGGARDRRLGAWVALSGARAPVAGMADVFLAVLAQVAHAASHAIGQRAPGRSLWITPKEQDVLDRLILGYSVREIAAELGRSPHTMHDHVKSLHRKLGASNRGDLIARALGHHRTPATPTEAAQIPPMQLTEVRPYRASAAVPSAGTAG